MYHFVVTYMAGLPLVFFITFEDAQKSAPLERTALPQAYYAETRIAGQRMII